MGEEHSDDYAALARLARREAEKHSLDVGPAACSAFSEFIGEAVRYFRLAHEQAPDDPALHIELAEALADAGEEEEALARLQNLRGTVSDQKLLAQVFYNFGLLTFSAARRRARADRSLPATDDEYEAGYDYYRKALALDPGHEQAAVMLSDELCNFGEFDDGLAVLRAALEHRPDSSALLQQLAYQSQNARLWDQAIETWRRLRRARPLDDDEAQHFAECLLRAGRIVEGVEEGLRARDLHNLSFAEIPHFVPEGLRGGAYDQLVRETARLAEQSPKDYETRAMLAMLLNFLGYGGARVFADILIDEIDSEDRGHFETLAERAVIRINEELLRREITEMYPVRNPWPPEDPLLEYQARPYGARPAPAEEDGDADEDFDETGDDEEED